MQRLVLRLRMDVCPASLQRCAQHPNVCRGKRGRSQRKRRAAGLAGTPPSRAGRTVPNEIHLRRRLLQRSARRGRRSSSSAANAGLDARSFAASCTAGENAAAYLRMPPLIRRTASCGRGPPQPVAITSARDPLALPPRRTTRPIAALRWGVTESHPSRSPAPLGVAMRSGVAWHAAPSSRAAQHPSACNPIPEGLAVAG